MTASLSTSLFCDHQTRPSIDGIQTRCGLQFGPTDMTVERTRYLAREYGWTSTGISDFCPEHSTSRKALYA